jgi:hypothetical protein
VNAPVVPAFVRVRASWTATLVAGAGMAAACSADGGSAGTRRDGAVGDGAAVVPDGDGSGATPAPVEDCNTPFDDNDDGQANEQCGCEPGTSQRCFERPADQFNGMCRMGTQQCVAAAEFATWGPCEHSWLPLAAYQNACEITETFPEMSARRAPVDIIWFVDTSGSMDAEIRYVNTNLNRFGTELESAGLDYRVVMVASRGPGTYQVCVPPPLGSAGCADGPRLRHVDQVVASTDGLRLLLSTYPRWQDFLRSDSAKFFVAVTDDESALPADSFDAAVRGWPGFAGYTFNSIVGYENRADCPTLAVRGGQYLILTDRTMGERARVCATDWSAIFTSFARTIARRTNAWELATPAHPDSIQVWFRPPGGTRTQLTSGWTYDAATHRVTIAPTALPPEGSAVEVLYRPLASSP